MSSVVLVANGLSSNGFSADSLRADRLMAQAGKTFHRAARLLPVAVREDVVCLYAFCRQVDDLADEPAIPAAARLRALEAVAAAFEGGSLPELRAAGWVFPAEGAMAEAARLLVGAAAGDLQQRQPRVQEDLLAYAFGVAGTVGIAMAYVLQAEPAGFGAAVALGMAMQLSNIARDVAEDLREGRVYLPSCWVSAAAVQQALGEADPAASRGVLAATGEVLSLAERLYEAAFDGIWSLPWRVRWSILAAALCYREIGREVRRRGELSWTERVVVSNRRKLWLIALAGGRLALPRFWLPRRRLIFSPVLGQAVLATLGRLRIAS